MRCANCPHLILWRSIKYPSVAEARCGLKPLPEVKGRKIDWATDSAYCSTTPIIPAEVRVVELLKKKKYDPTWCPLNNKESEVK